VATIPKISYQEDKRDRKVLDVCAPLVFTPRFLSSLWFQKWFSGGGFVLNFISCGTALFSLNLAPVFA
jgi:hypothetical protein